MARDLDINITKNSEILQEKLIFMTRSLHDILEKELDKKIIQGLRKLDILYLEQLFNSKGTMMITQYQLKKIKELSTKERKSFQFRDLEKILLDNKNSRSLKLRFTFKEVKNIAVIRPNLSKISEKKSKKE